MKRKKTYKTSIFPGKEPGTKYRKKDCNFFQDFVFFKDLGNEQKSVRYYKKVENICKDW